MHDLLVRVDDGDFTAVGVDEEGDCGVTYYLTIKNCFNHTTFTDEFSQEFREFGVDSGGAELDFFGNNFFYKFVQFVNLFSSGFNFFLSQFI